MKNRWRSFEFAVHKIRVESSSLVALNLIITSTQWIMRIMIMDGSLFLSAYLTNKRRIYFKQMNGEMFGCRSLLIDLKYEGYSNMFS